MSRERIYLQISEKLQREVLEESGFRCAVPHCRDLFMPGVDELTRVVELGKNEASNLIALCGKCRQLAGGEKLPSEQMAIYKSVIAALHLAFDRVAVDQLLLLDAASHEPLKVSGDAVLRLSGVISAGLLSYETVEPGYRLQLTEKGRRFVSDWKNGVNPDLFSER